MLDQEKIGKLIASLRKEKNMTQEQLAEKLGVSNRSISRWENGKSMPDFILTIRNKNIRIENLRYCQARAMLYI